MIFVAESRNGDRIEYRDTKRYLWVLSLVMPIYTGGAALWYAFADRDPILPFVSLVLSFVVLPLVDMLVGESDANPPEEVIERMSEDGYYRVLLYLAVAVYWFAFLASAITVGTGDLPVWAAVLLTLAAGVSSGTSITVAHELGHKSSLLDRWAAKVALAISGYAHFCIEHNRGHHTWASTPEDPSSARFGESVYAFALRDIPHAFLRGVRGERDRLARKGIGFWSLRNDIVQGWLMSGLVALALVLVFGWVMVPFLVVHHALAWYMLTQANYVEHYGLKRLRKPNGRYEPMQPRHSWNTNHVVSNLMLFHLQRHSDHHANPMRPYQALRDHDDIPRLPSGYPGAFVLAAIPPLWRRVMDPKVIEVAGGDMERVNTGP